MKVAILAGGTGSRLSEETVAKPKPMVEIGGRPILWHILKHYAHYGHKDFVIALGYRGEYVKRYFVDYSSLASDLTISLREGTVQRLQTDNGNDEDWTLSLVDTGQRTQTGGRIKRLAEHVGNETFMLTWGDGVSNVDLDKLLAFHRAHGKLATLTAVRPPARFGHLELEEDKIVEFSEKPQIGEGWINGAFFVLEPEVLDYIDGDDTRFELEPLERLAREGQLMAYRHLDFWQCMDTLRDKILLDEMWESGRALWKTWS
ncbi:glucose-1-phosphate cytidylyltransferase [Gaiella occulta]|uniref:Glucose-1-phosphate cytidylyltransferase n=1 Tax=Gaiella occulta TaxID=1002870 RepID=A0A7M2YZB5_9ACTN|nr:glucose-1-phosphate cytidylyltransferase [Gaiella occulta]RDI74849.1 glucose-1-phosphate cytidylyltransferase [Gaiella occulta]